MVKKRMAGRHMRMRVFERENSLRNPRFVLGTALKKLPL
jgi:hypothetical protein